MGPNEITALDLVVFTSVFPWSYVPQCIGFLFVRLPRESVVLPRAVFWSPEAARSMIPAASGLCLPLVYISRTSRFLCVCSPSRISPVRLRRPTLALVPFVSSDIAVKV